VHGLCCVLCVACHKQHHPCLAVCRLHKERRWQFELALACGQSDTDQLQQEEDILRKGRDSSDATEADEDYEMVCQEATLDDGFAGAGGPPPPPGGMPPPPPAAAPMPRSRAAEPHQGLARMRVAQAEVRHASTPGQKTSSSWLQHMLPCALALPVVCGAVASAATACCTACHIMVCK
jgi:hypothetical protein